MSTNKKPIENQSDTEVYAQLKEYLNNKESYTYSINNLEHFSTTIPVVKKNIDVKNKKYRPFESAEECWEEMQKHKPFGWIKYKEKNEYTTYCNISGNCDFQADFEDFNFADDTPFGKEIE